MSNPGDRILVDEVKPQINFCEWLRQEWTNGLQGMDVDLNNLKSEEALKLLRSIRIEWRLQFGE
jgi:hypothetical protein